MYEAIKVKPGLQGGSQDIEDNRDICQEVFPIEWSPPTRDMYVMGSKAKSSKASKPVGTQCLTSDIEVQDLVFALLDFGLYWVAISSPCPLSSIWEWECIFCPLCVGSLQFAFFFQGIIVKRCTVHLHYVYYGTTLVMQRCTKR